MTKGAIFSLVRFEAKRLGHMDYWGPALVFVLLGVVFREFGSVEYLTHLTEVVGSLLMLGAGLDLWKSGVRWLKPPAIPVGRYVLVGLLGRGVVIAVFWFVVRFSFAGSVDWWRVCFFYLAGVAVALVAKDRRRRCVWGLTVWVVFVYLIPWGLAMSGMGDKRLWLVLTGLTAGVLALLAVGRKDGDVGLGDGAAIGLGGLERGKFYFLHIRDAGQRERFCRYFESKQAVVVRRAGTGEMDEEVRLRTWIEFLSGVRGRSMELLLARLGEWGIGGDQLALPLKRLSRELLTLVHVAVGLAGGGSMVVLDDVAANVPDELQDLFRKMVRSVLPDAVVLYLGGRMYETNVGRDLWESGTARLIAVDPAKIVF